MCSSSVADLNESLSVRMHEWDSHSDLASFWQYGIGVILELLDNGKDVIPSSGIQGHDVFSQFEQDLIHGSRSSDGFDEHSASDGADWDIKVALCGDEDVIPQSGFVMGLELGKVIEDSTQTQLLSEENVMEKVHSEIEETPGHRLLIDDDMDLIQVPASGSHQKSAHLVVELVYLTSFLELEGSFVGLN